MRSRDPEHRDKQTDNTLIALAQRGQNRFAQCKKSSKQEIWQVRTDRYAFLVAKRVFPTEHTIVLYWRIRAMRPITQLRGGLVILTAETSGDRRKHHGFLHHSDIAEQHSWSSCMWSRVGISGVAAIQGQQQLLKGCHSKKVSQSLATPWSWSL